MALSAVTTLLSASSCAVTALNAPDDERLLLPSRLAAGGAEGERGALGLRFFGGMSECSQAEAGQAKQPAAPAAACCQLPLPLPTALISISRSVGLAKRTQPTRPWCQRKTQNTGMPVFFLAVILTAADRNPKSCMRASRRYQDFQSILDQYLMNND